MKGFIPVNTPLLSGQLIIVLLEISLGSVEGLIVMMILFWQFLRVMEELVLMMRLLILVLR